MSCYNDFTSLLSITKSLFQRSLLLPIITYFSLVNLQMRFQASSRPCPGWQELLLR